MRNAALALTICAGLGGCASWEEFDQGFVGVMTGVTNGLVIAAALEGGGDGYVPPPQAYAGASPSSTSRPPAAVTAGRDSSDWEPGVAPSPPSATRAAPVGSTARFGGHDPSAVATQCLQQGPATLTNTCSETIDLRFCFVGEALSGHHATFACDRPSGMTAWHGPGGHHLGPGQTKTFAKAPSGQTVAYRAAACRRPFTLMYAEFDGQRLTYQCVR